MDKSLLYPKPRIGATVHWNAGTVHQIVPRGVLRPAVPPLNLFNIPFEREKLTLSYIFY